MGVVCEALQAALSEILEPAADCGISVTLSLEDEDEVGGRNALRIRPEAPAEFAFEVVLADPNDRAPAHEALRLEAEFAGALKLLPALVQRLGSAERLSVRLDII